MMTPSTYVRATTRSVKSAVEGAPEMTVEGCTFAPHRIQVHYSRDLAGAWQVDNASMFGSDESQKNFLELGTLSDWHYQERQPATVQEIMALPDLPEWARRFIADNLPTD